MRPIERIHHISATVGDPVENYTFYRDVLKLRLVKKTVNFENDKFYHLYFSNDNVDQGTIMTLFPLGNSLYGRVGGGQVRTVAFLVPKDSIEEWKVHLKLKEVLFKERLFNGKASLTFNDPNELSIALVESNHHLKDNKIIGFYGVELLSTKPKETLHLLMDKMGLLFKKKSQDFYHLEMLGKEKHQILIRREIERKGRLGIGTVHHIAWSVPNKEYLMNWKLELNEDSLISDIEDRKYFKSLYMRDPGQIIYEFATEGPGFLVDEHFDELGENLKLPQHFEEKRKAIEANLPLLK